jgi:hypothetical protein
MIFLSPSKQMPGQCLEYGHNHVVSLQCITRQHPVATILRMLLRVRLNKLQIN